MIFYGWFVSVADVHAAELFLDKVGTTLMKLDYKSSATMVWDLNLDASLYRFGRLSRDRKRRLMSIVWDRSFGRQNGIWSESELRHTWFFIWEEGVTGLRFMCLLIGVDFRLATIDADIAYTQFEFSMGMKCAFGMHYHYIIYLCITYEGLKILWFLCNKEQLLFKKVLVTFKVQ